MRKHRHWFGRALAGFLVLGMSFSWTGNVDTVQAAKAKKVKSISVSKPETKTLALKKGEKFSLKVKVKPSGAAKNISYRSSKKAVVSVSKKGVLKAKKAGKAVITISSKTKPKKKQKVTVTVYKKFQKVKKVALSQKKADIAVGDKLSLKASVSPKKATVKKLAYTSSKKSVATVSKSGTVTAKKAGKAKITVYAEDGRGAKASCQVTVSEKTASPAPSVPAVTSTPAASPAPSSKSSPVPTVKPDDFPIISDKSTVSVYIDKNGEDYDGLSLVADSFAGDIALVSAKGAEAKVTTDTGDLGEYAVIVGSIGNNAVIDSLIASGKVDVSAVKGKRETYRLQTVDNPLDGVRRAIVVAGSDKRGAIYGLYHISELMGVSPWVYWGDTVPEKRDTIQLDGGEVNVTSKEPSVKYRGIFLNDEAPSLTSWVRDNFGNYNEDFYAHVFELILRCKGNYLWPAMWNNDFSSDGKSEPIANAKLADQYGIVMGTSHHEPMCRAGIEWGRDYQKYGNAKTWDFAENEEAITNFWKDGIARNKDFENVYTLGMRGESDSALGGTVEENIELLKRIITTQKQILADNGLSDAPKVLTVYKEVENFWHGTDKMAGLKTWDGLDDVIIMLCDDNFGNMRTLATDDTINRDSGWGMYYHFDYHGGPTSYEWINTVQLNKTWEQMSMAYEHGVDDIWIVNVGDLKPMEMDISYFLDLAYDYDTWGKDGGDKTETYMKNWVKQQFASSLSEEQTEAVKSLMEDYKWLNGSCKPESLKVTTYNSVNYNEAQEMLARVDQMMKKAEECKAFIPEDLQAAYYQLVYFPTVASANVAKMYLSYGLNQYYAGIGSTAANLYGSMLQQSIAYDKELTETYNNDMPGVGDKWKGMMSSDHVGFISWQSTGWSYPEATWVKPEDKAKMIVTLQGQAEAFTEGKCTLSDFTDINDESYTVSVSNTSGEGLDYTIVPDADWIRVSKEKGHVRTRDTFQVSVDWSKVKENKSGTVTLACGDQTVVVNVNAKVYDTAGLSDKTYVYANGYVSIMPGNYVSTGAGKNGTQIKVIDGYGKTGQMMKSLPTNAQISDTVEDAAYAEYLVSVPKAGTYKLTAFTGPSNNIDRDSISIYFGVSVNDGAAAKCNTLQSNFAAGEYSGSWTSDVSSNGRVTETEVTLQEGVNKVRIYAIDPTFLLQKLVISEESVQPSHLGPQESYYVGKEKTEKTDYILNDSYVLPGRINGYDCEDSEAEEGTLKAKAGESYTYDAVVTEENMYHFSVTAKSSNGAKAKILWRGNGTEEDVEIGTLTFSDTEEECTIGGGHLLSPGFGKITLSMVSGEAEIRDLAVTIKEKFDLPGTIDAVNYDGSEASASGMLSVKAGETYSYYGIIEEEDIYQFAIRGKSQDGAVVKLYWNDEEAGSVTLGTEQKKMVIPTSMNLSAGSGMIRMVVESGQAQISSIQMELFDEEEKLAVAVKSSSDQDGYEAAWAYDGDKYTSWKPADSDTQKWIELDFGASYYFDRFSLRTTGEGITGYEIQVDENGTWKPVYTGTEVKNGEDIFIQGKEAIRSQKVRFVFKGTVQEVNEISLTPYVNWAMEDKVTLSGENRYNKPFDVPNSIVDGDRITKGMEDETGISSDSKRHSMKMEFSQEHMIDTVRLVTLQDAESKEAGTGVTPDLEMTSSMGQYSYRFSYYDGSNWKEIGATVKPETGKNPKVISEFSLKRKVKTSAIKVEVYTSHWIRINELEVVETPKFEIAK